MSDAEIETKRHCFELPVTVRFGDTDPYGVVYFASYFRYCHHGIEGYLKHNGLPPHEFFRNQEEGFGLPIVSAACDFLKPVWYGQELHLVVGIQRIKEKSITFSFHFYFHDRDELVARGEATMVAIGRDWRARPLPERLCKAISGNEQVTTSGSE